MQSTGDPVDGGLFRLMHGFALRDANQPVMRAVEARTQDTAAPTKAGDVDQTAMAAARDAYTKDHRRASADALTARAYWGAALAAEERPFTLAEDTRAPAKSIHYLVSGAIAARTASLLPFLPRFLRDPIALGVAHFVGFIKECADHIKGTGFNRHDLATDDAGAHAALESARAAAPVSKRPAASLG